jgi:hypothetical protein
MNNASDRLHYLPVRLGLFEELTVIFGISDPYARKDSDARNACGRVLGAHPSDHKHAPEADGILILGAG